MYTLDPTTSYTMPTCANFRPPKPWEWPTRGMRYGKSPTMSVTFLTDPAAAARCLPEPFRLTDEALVTISAVACDDVDWIGGRAYNLVGVDIAVIFDGQIDKNVHGSFCVVMWEDLCEAIIGGREHSGVPKIFADINIDKTSDTAWHCRVSRYGNTFLELAVSDLKPTDAKVCAELEKARHDATWICYKYIPRLENDGADVSYATVYPSSGQCAACHRGEGSVQINSVTFEQVPTQQDVINLLANLPILEVRSASWTDWKEVRAINRCPRRLR